MSSFWQKKRKCLDVLHSIYTWLGAGSISISKIWKPLLISHDQLNTSWFILLILSSCNVVQLNWLELLKYSETWARSSRSQMLDRDVRTFSLYYSGIKLLNHYFQPINMDACSAARLAWQEMKNPNHLINCICVCQSHSRFRRKWDTGSHLEGTGPKACKDFRHCRQTTEAEEDHPGIQDVPQIKMRSALSSRWFLAAGGS